MSVEVTAVTPPRGGGAQEEVTFAVESFNGTVAWGSQPGSFTLVYAGLASGPITRGAHMTVKVPQVVGPNTLTTVAHTFYGVCKSDEETLSDQGATRTLQFNDFREYLQWDDVFCAFNIPDVRILNGVRTKRYKHMFPADFLGHVWTYTDGPLSAATICDAMFNADTVLTDWVAVYHAAMDLPAFNIDCLSGKKLGAALQEVSDRLGLVYGLVGGPYRLVWIRKGESGVIPSFPAASNERQFGSALSGNPTAIRILGERNAYQVMDVALAPDWASAWQEFLVVDAFADDIYRRGTDPKTGIRFNATPGDPEQYIGRQLAHARAAEIKVWEYVELRNTVRLGEEPINDGNRFIDWRKFSGHSRMDMPAALYIRTLLFRAFKPNINSFSNWYGEGVLLDSVELVDRILTDVWHDPVTGKMFWDAAIPLDGNGYAIVEGYRVGEDLFRTLRPDQYRVDMFANSRKVWQHTTYQTDDSGEGTRFLLFDEPVIVSDNLFVTVDGQTVVNANFTLTVPAAKAALVFHAERFREVGGSGDRFATENVGGLYREAVVSSGVFYEVPFADGQTASAKAAEIGNSLLLRQFAYLHGSHQNAGIFGTQITDMIDRVAVVYSARGKFEAIDFTNERSRNNFEPERSFDRSLRSQNLLPGQEELKREANTARLLASAFKQNPGIRKSLSDLVNGNVGPDVPLKVVLVATAGVETVPTNLPVGTILRKEPTVTTTTPNSKTVCVLPSHVDNAKHTVFEAVTVRDGEDPTVPLRGQSTGYGLARVKGPVNATDMVGLSSGPAGADDGNYFVANATTPVARVLSTIADASVKLVPVQFGGGGGGGGDLAVWQIG